MELEGIRLTNEPHLRHAQYSAANSKTEGTQSRNTGWQLVWLVVCLRGVTRGTLAENDMFRQSDTLVDSKPVPNHQHEVLQHGLEVAVARDGDAAVDDCADECPDETGDLLGVAGEDEKRE